MLGNFENFVGVAQVPIGLAGPLKIHGEHATGDFYIPLATTEGTLVASYNRGMRLISECGGVTTTVVDQSMQRSPVFEFDSARESRSFGRWIAAIGRYNVRPLRFMSFNYTTGDAAGQNMSGKAMLACEWIVANCPAKTTFMLSGNVDTDKKHSAINMLLTRGRRVAVYAPRLSKRSRDVRLLFVDHSNVVIIAVLRLTVIFRAEEQGR